MLTANPWVAYVSIVGPLLAGYYLLVGLIFYRQELKASIFKSKSAPGKPAARDAKARPAELESFQEPGIQNAELDADQDQQEESWENEPMMQQLEELSVQIKNAIEEAHDKDYSKEEFVLLAQMTLREYPAIYGTPFQLSVNQLIEAELAKYGSIHLESEDRMRIWNQED
ncbi:hypothetical protein [Dyadobacter sp. CY356]|uniref:hypothetical protein n=1 Tax=Dyadobacter sp. CY356 TaxID=2906442 RepID=UPI001F17D2BF|nr:hypothetical protein [Dyadobacter sp. CY356]MCF0055198.1 hypothetical protein [Dyadobacter sp. CY356]